MKKLFLATATLLAATMLTAGHANACRFFDFSCNAAKQKAEKTQMVINIIDAGRKAGWKDVRRDNREIAEMRKVGLDPTNGNLIGVLKDVNDEHFESLDQYSWEGVVEMIGRRLCRQADRQGKAWCRRPRQPRNYDKVTQNDSEAALRKPSRQNSRTSERSKCSSADFKVDDLDSELELQVPSAPSAGARTLDEAGVDIARSIMDGGNFDDMVSRAAAKVGMTQRGARGSSGCRVLRRLGNPMNPHGPTGLPRPAIRLPLATMPPPPRRIRPSGPLPTAPPRRPLSKRITAIEATYG